MIVEHQRPATGPARCPVLGQGGLANPGSYGTTLAGLVATFDV